MKYFTRSVKLSRDIKKKKEIIIPPKGSSLQEIKEKKEQVKIIDQEENNQYLLLSYILNDKIKQLEHQLADCIEKIKMAFSQKFSKV